MTLLLHGRDVTADTAESLRSGRGAETTTDLLFDLHHPQIPLGQIVVKGDSKVMQKRQRLWLVLRQAIQEVLTFTLFLGAAPPCRCWCVALLFLRASLQDRRIALLVVLDLRARQCCLVVPSGGVDRALALQQHLLHLTGPCPPHLLVDENQLAQVMGVAQSVLAV